MLAYKHRDTVLHSLDPRVKMLWLVILLAILFSNRTVYTAAISLAFVIILFWLSSIPLKEFLVHYKGIVFFLALPFVLGFIFVSPEYGLASSVILLSAVSISALFVMTTEQQSILAALCFFGVPKQMAFSLSMSLYFLPVFERKIQSVRFSQAARAYSSKNPVPVVVPFLHSVFRRARNLSISMDARAFDPDKAVVSSELRMRSIDWVALVILGFHVLTRFVPSMSLVH